MNTDTVLNTGKWQEDQALERYRLIAPLLDPSLDKGAKGKLRKDIALANEISVRSLYRYESAYQQREFQGLKPMNREKRRSQKLPDNFDELLQEAMQLRREVPERSVEQIITILELEQRVAPGVLKRSTLERHLYRAGFGRRQLQTYREARESSSRRFCKPHRMMLLQGDIKYGPTLPIGKNGAKVKTYLSSAIDDHSRMILASRYYAKQDGEIVEDTFHTVLLRYGKFDACYFDNGSQYVAHQLRLSLSKLGISVRFAPLRSGKSKGKIEKFHQVADSFQREVKLKKVKTLEELNAYWQIYLDSYYSTKPHEGIAEYYQSLGSPVPEAGISPVTEFNRDQRPLSFIDASKVGEAFLHHEQRRVDRGACISFRGRLYETRPSLIGFTVGISYDPSSPEQLTVSYPGMEPFKAVPVTIASFVKKKQELPVSLTTVEPPTSRFLDALAKKHAETEVRVADAISFAAMRKEETDNV